MNLTLVTAVAITAFNVTFAITTRRFARASRRAVPNDLHSRPGDHPILGSVEGADTVEDAREGAREDPRLVDQPVRAWKFQDVSRSPDGRITLFGYGTTYGVEAVASCEKNRFAIPSSARQTPHQAPDEDCTCGFYGLKEKPSIIGPGQYLLEVEMYGKVIPHELGYRAEKMRVLSITARPRCSATVLTEYTHIGRNGYESQDQIEEVCEDPPHFMGWDGEPLCAKHAIESRHRFFGWEPAPVSCETEWRWAD